MNKIITVILSFAIIFSASSLICYASEYDDYLDQVNEKYQIQLEKVDGAEENVSIDQFKESVDKIAKLHIKNQEEISKVESIAYESSDLLSPLSITYKTKTAKKNADDIFYIKATYEYATTSPYRVRNFSVIKYGYRDILSLYTFTKKSGYPTVQIIDGGRSGYVVYKGTLTDGKVKDTNYQFYASFTYSS